jgi:hypothetical protein
MEFTKAVKTKSKLRLAIDGVSGSGKTYTALAIASGMGGRIALIDTEHGSAALYADRFDFDAVELQQFQIENYLEALEAAEAGGYAIVIIDSTTHAWEALLERVDRIADLSYKGNSFRAWGEATPLYRKLIEAMLNYPGHLIVTCRSKTEYAMELNGKEKLAPKKVGMAAVQRQGFEYEFTLAMTMSADHVGQVTKDRTGKFQDAFIEKPGKKFGAELVKWLGEGTEETPESTLLYSQKLLEIGGLMKSECNEQPIYTEEEIEKVREKVRQINGSGTADASRLPELEKLLAYVKENTEKRIERKWKESEITGRQSP